MRKLLVSCAIAFVCLAGSPCFAADDAGYVAVAPGSRDTVDGRCLLVAADAVILGMISAYAALLLARSRAASRELACLEKRLGL
ncbi:MAG: hypothetical protein PHU25_20015 [Deltaproteobacteria bacterium]|nr:hypothetical protein [Deltaproteobacteria bacterium]